MNSDKCLNQILIVLQSISKKLDVMIQINDLDQDHDHKSNDPDHDHDHDHHDTISDHDLIDWFSKLLTDFGIESSRRPLHTVLRNIRYFRKNYNTIKNPQKYLLSFLPAASPLVIEEDPAESQEVLGFPRTTIIAKQHLLTREIVEKLRDLEPMLIQAPKNYASIKKNHLWMNIFTAHALKHSLIQ